MLTLLVASLTPAAVATVPRAEIAPNVWMPLLAAGTWQYNDSVAASSVANAIAAGFTHIDTALDYGNQRGVSAGLARSGVARDEIFITTKIPGCGFTGINPRTCASDTLAAAKDNVVQLSSSYPALQQVDLMLLHFPPCVSAPPGLPSPINSTCCAQKTGCSGANLDAVAQQWKAMEDALAANYTRAIGVSNFCSKCLAAATSISASPVQPAVNQFQLHVGMGSDPQRFLSHAKAAGITPQACPFPRAHARAHMHMRRYVCTCMYMRMCIRTCVYLHICAYVHMCIYTYTHAYV